MSDYVLNDFITLAKMKNNELNSDFFKDYSKLIEDKEKYKLSKLRIENGDLEGAKNLLIEQLESLGETELFCIYIYIDLGLITQNKDKLIEAFGYYSKALEIALLHNNEKLISRCFVNIGEVLIYLNYSDEALYMYNQINLGNIIEDKLYYILALANLSYLNYHLNNLELGNYYSKLFLDLLNINKCNDKWNKILINYILAERYISVANYKNGIYYLNKNLEMISKESGTIEELAINLECAKLKKKMGNHLEARDLLIENLEKAKEKECKSFMLQIVETLILFNCEEDIDTEILIKILLQNKIDESLIKVKLIDVNIKSIKEKIKLYEKKREDEYRTKSLEVLKNSLEDINVKDILTEAFNRKYLDKFLNNTYFLTKKMCTFIMIDIDNFKLVNDILGHLFGDETLTQFAGRFDEITGECGKVFRYGGDEFLIIYEHDSLEDSDILIDKLRYSIKSLEVWNDIKACRITLSLGAITYVSKNQKIYNSNNLLNKCDKLMYYGKKDGKNQVRHEVLS